MKIFVGGLSQSTTKESLNQYFQQAAARGRGAGPENSPRTSTGNEGGGNQSQGLERYNTSFARVKRCMFLLVNPPQPWSCSFSFQVPMDSLALSDLGFQGFHLFLFGSGDSIVPGELCQSVQDTHHLPLALKLARLVILPLPSREVKYMLSADTVSVLPTQLRRGEIQKPRVGVPRALAFSRCPLSVSRRRCLRAPCRRARPCAPVRSGRQLRHDGQGLGPQPRLRLRKLPGRGLRERGPRSAREKGKTLGLDSSRLLSSGGGFPPWRMGKLSDSGFSVVRIRGVRIGRASWTLVGRIRRPCPVVLVRMRLCVRTRAHVFVRGA